MAERARIVEPSLYDRDFAAWSEEQGRLLRARSRSDLDWDNLAEEIETLGRSERSEIRSRLVILLQHLLKWEHQPERRKTGWRASILDARDQLNEQIEASPSLKAYPAAILPRQYELARLRASDETGLPMDRFPPDCPYSLADILNDAFFPGRAD